MGKKKGAEGGPGFVCWVVVVVLLLLSGGEGGGEEGGRRVEVEVESGANRECAPCPLGEEEERRGEKYGKEVREYYLKTAHFTFSSNLSSLPFCEERKKVQSPLLQKQLLHNLLSSQRRFFFAILLHNNQKNFAHFYTQLLNLLSLFPPHSFFLSILDSHSNDLTPVWFLHFHFTFSTLFHFYFTFILLSLLLFHFHCTFYFLILTTIPQIKRSSLLGRVLHARGIANQVVMDNSKGEGGEGGEGEEEKRRKQLEEVSRASLNSQFHTFIFLNLSSSSFFCGEDFLSFLSLSLSHPLLISRPLFLSSSSPPSHFSFVLSLLSFFLPH